MVVSNDGKVSYEPDSGPCVECGGETTQTVFNFEWSGAWTFLHHNPCTLSR